MKDLNYHTQSQFRRKNAESYKAFVMALEIIGNYLKKFNLLKELLKKLDLLKNIKNSKTILKRHEKPTEKI